MPTSPHAVALDARQQTLTEPVTPTAASLEAGDAEALAVDSGLSGPLSTSVVPSSTEDAQAASALKDSFAPPPPPLRPEPARTAPKLSSSDAEQPVALLPSPAPRTVPQVRDQTHDHVVPYGQSPGPLRLILDGLNNQGGWLLPFAAFGMLALIFARPRRRDPRTAALIVLGGFFVVEAGVLSFSRGIVHPYYVSALGPGTAAMVGIGLVALAALARRGRWVAAALAVAGTVVVQIAILYQDGYMLEWAWALGILAILGIVVLAMRRQWATATMTFLLALLLVAPTAYALTLWSRPVQATFPAAGPDAAGGYGGVGLPPEDLAVDYSLAAYLLGHGPGTRFTVLTQASVTSAPLILLGVHAAAMGGYAGIDPALSGRGLARLVARHKARYVLIGGGYQYLGGNAASQAAERSCPEVPRRLWAGAELAAAEGTYLLDCAGQQQTLTLPPTPPPTSPAGASADSLRRARDAARPAAVAARRPRRRSA